MSESPKFSDKPIAEQIRRVAVDDLRRCRLSRDQVAEGLSIRNGRSITRAQIDAYLAESKPHRFPLELLHSWVLVTGSRQLLELVCMRSGLYLMDETEREFAEFGRTVIARQKAESREAALRVSLGEKS